MRIDDVLKLRCKTLLLFFPFEKFCGFTAPKKAKQTLNYLCLSLGSFLYFTVITNYASNMIDCCVG